MPIKPKPIEGLHAGMPSTLRRQGHDSRSS